MAVVIVYCIFARRHKFAALFTRKCAGSHMHKDGSMLSVTLYLLTVITPLLWWCGLVTPFRQDRMCALLVCVHWETLSGNLLVIWPERGTHKFEYWRNYYSQPQLSFINDVSNKQDATNSVYWSFYWSIWICSTCFGRQTRPSSGALLTVYTALVQRTDIATDRCHRSAAISGRCIKVEQIQIDQ